MIFLAYGNVSIGDCSAATAGNYVQIVTRHRPRYSSVLDVAYALDPEHEGIQPAALFTYWQTHAIGGFKAASWAPATVTLGISEPLIAEVEDMGLWRGAAWTIANEAFYHEDDGPHMLVIDRVTRGGLDVVTWGKHVWMSWPYWRAHGIAAWRVSLD